MHYHPLSVRSVLVLGPLRSLATSLTLHWDDMRMKHTWSAVPANWETLGYPPAGTTIDLHVALKPDRENALMDARYEVSDPRQPKHVLDNTSPCTRVLKRVLMCAVALLQIWRAPVQGAGRLARRAAPRHARACQFMAFAPWRVALLHLNNTWRLLADGHWRAGVPSQQTPGRVMPTLP